MGHLGVSVEVALLSATAAQGNPFAAGSGVWQTPPRAGQALSASIQVKMPSDSALAAHLLRCRNHRIGF
jgi:hypothetical protein